MRKARVLADLAAFEAEGLIVFEAHPVRREPGQGTVDNFRRDCLRELEKIQRAWPDLHYRTVKGALLLSPSQLRLVE